MSLFKDLDGDFSPFEPMNVFRWPLWGRRMFVLTAPISVPLWLATLIVVTVAAVVIGIPLLLLALIGMAVVTLWER